MSRITVILLGLVLLGPLRPVWAEEAANPPERASRLAYVEAYPYWSYSDTLDHLRAYLDRVGWGERATFPPELHFSFSEGEEEDYDDFRRQAREILARDDYDLLLTFGTTATRIMLEENAVLRRPMIGLSISDPLGAGLIVSADDSGAEHFTTVVFDEPHGGNLFFLFHELMKFGSLGIMYRDDPDGRAYTYLEEAREVARDRGFKLVEYANIGAGEPLEDCLAAVRTLIGQGVDAIFLPNISCFDPNQNDLKELFDLIYRNKKMTFVADDRALVRQFAMAGLVFSDVKLLADFQGRQIVNILSGESPGEQNMAAPFQSKIMLNMAAANRLGQRLDLGILALSDELYLSLPGLDK
ncbi:MAG: hypothetical protein LBJ64_04920 [Deltaproteobacteria bacterium]|jgi:ABC-type uncharacterized transport system substrate-binding protein|nr:hypothetical protein [Deltaproteobacteria bacterium]